MLEIADLSRRIRTALTDADVEISDMTGTGDHFEARVVSAAFGGKTMVEQHKMVYAPLKDLLESGVLHALSLRTFTPDQWQRYQTRKA
jgi:stress-induced morphogen